MGSPEGSGLVPPFLKEKTLRLQLVTHAQSIKLRPGGATA